MRRSIFKEDFRRGSTVLHTNNFCFLGVRHQRSIHSFIRSLALSFAHSTSVIRPLIYEPTHSISQSLTVFWFLSPLLQIMWISIDKLWKWSKDFAKFNRVLVQIWLSICGSYWTLWTTILRNHAIKTTKLYTRKTYTQISTILLMKWSNYFCTFLVPKLIRPSVISNGPYQLIRSIENSEAWEIKACWTISFGFPVDLEQCILNSVYYLWTLLFFRNSVWKRKPNLIIHT